MQQFSLCGRSGRRVRAPGLQEGGFAGYVGRVPHSAGGDRAMMRIADSQRSLGARLPIHAAPTELDWAFGAVVATNMALLTELGLSSRMDFSSGAHLDTATGARAVPGSQHTRTSIPLRPRDGSRSATIERIRAMVAVTRCTLSSATGRLTLLRPGTDALRRRLFQTGY